MTAFRAYVTMVCSAALSLGGMSCGGTPGSPKNPSLSDGGSVDTTGGADVSGPGSAGSGGGSGTGGASGSTGSGGSTTISDGSTVPPSDAGGMADTASPPADRPANGPAPGEYGIAAPMLEPNSEMAVTALDGKIYILGGYPSSRETQRTLQIFDTVRGVWSLGMPLPIPIHHPVTAGVNGKLYSLGGQRDMGGAPDTNLAYVYDPTGNAWTPLPNMMVARGGGAGAVIGDKIYVVGGRPPAGNAFEVFDISDNMWTTLAPLPTQLNDRNHLAAAAIGGKVYVAGGRYNGGNVGSPITNSLDAYDPGTNTWTVRKPMLRPRGGVAGVAALGCFHVYGGEGSNIGEPMNVFPDHDVYNPMTDTWTAAKRLPIPFHGVTGGAFVDGVIYMPGGGTSSGGNSGSTMHQTYTPAMNCGG